MKYLLFLVFLIVIGCRSYQISDINFEKNFVPPNGFKVSDNLFIDKTEISNAYWKEYQYWLKNIFGEDSFEYISSSPDTTLWIGETLLDTTLVKKYHSSYMYNNFPVVGITQQQALEYSKWRSDRVFEFLLIKSGKIKLSNNQTGDNYFTIERYFSGGYFDYIPDTTIRLVPKFTLPTLSEIKLIEMKVNISNAQIIESCKKKRFKKCKQDYMYVNSKNNSNNYCEIYESPVKPVGIDCANASFLEVHNLIGNVSEWTKGYLETYGGSWLDEIDQNELIISNNNKSKSCDIGFRNIFKLEKRK